jgi:hypothetical protein
MFRGPVQAKMHWRFNAICGLRENMKLVICYHQQIGALRPEGALCKPLLYQDLLFPPYHSASPSDIWNAGGESAPRSIPHECPTE